MAILFRKIARAKWPEDKCDVLELYGDAISDLRTTGNTLSLWRIESEDDLPTAALALSASSKSDKIETISLVWMSEDLLRNKHIPIDEHSPGDTIVADLVGLHRDLYGITYKSLGDIASILMSELIDQKHYKRFSRSEVKKALAKAYIDNRIAEERCLPELLVEIKKAAGNVKNS